MSFCVVFLWQLYHYERKRGTTTGASEPVHNSVLYHYERKRGTTTVYVDTCSAHVLYHYERKWGTTTLRLKKQRANGLYHYERKWGTTTFFPGDVQRGGLYHYKRKWGTTTMSLTQIFRDDFTAYCIRIYRFRQSPKWRETFLTKIVPGNGCPLPWSSPGRHL